MVVVTGATSSGKSEVLRGLIDRYLTDARRQEQWKRKKRKPHVLTFEDPIERDLNRADWLDYTPRVKGVDVLNLADATRDALRQTPAVLLVGEVRNSREWRHLLDFAGTGHLVFATGHAGSLVEAMGKIFSGTGAHQPTSRALVADRLLALVHMRRTALTQSCSKDVSAQLDKIGCVPSLWRRTETGSKALMAEGQSSMLPHQSAGNHSSVGRRYFALQLWREAETRSDSIRLEIRRRCHTHEARLIEQKLKNQFISTALRWDLAGI